MKPSPPVTIVVATKQICNETLRKEGRKREKEGRQGVKKEEKMEEQKQRGRKEKGKVKKKETLILDFGIVMLSYSKLL